MKRSLLLSAMLVLVPLGCGGSGGGSPVNGGSGQSLTVLLGSDSNPDLKQAVVSVESVEISSNGSTWTSIGSPKMSPDLMALQGGKEAVLLSNASVPSGTFAVRITWATKNYSNGVLQPAYVVPTGSAVGYQMSMPTSTVFYGSINVPSGGNATALLMVDAADGIQGYSGPGTFAFNPAPVALEASASVTVTGNLSYSGSALPGVEVFAEYVDGLSGEPFILRRAISDANGNYILDGIPSVVNGASPVVLVVAMPCTPSASFAPQGALPVSVAGSGTYTGANIQFLGPTTPGDIALHATPASPYGIITVADLRSTVSFGLNTAYVIVRSQTMVSGATQDDYTFHFLPQSLFGVVATRYSGVPPLTASTPSSVAVAGGITTDITLGF